MYEEKTNIIKCPSCGKPCEQKVSGDLDSGWSGGIWGEGTYSRGVITVGYDCPHCGDADADVIIND